MNEEDLLNDIHEESKEYQEPNIINRSNDEVFDQEELKESEL